MQILSHGRGGIRLVTAVSLHASDCHLHKATEAVAERACSRRACCDRPAGGGTTYAPGSFVICRRLPWRWRGSTRLLLLPLLWRARRRWRYCPRLQEREEGVAEVLDVDLPRSHLCNRSDAVHLRGGCRREGGKKGGREGGREGMRGIGGSFGVVTKSVKK